MDGHVEDPRQAHFDIQSLTCSCGRKFSTFAAARIHVRDDHPHYMCPGCEELFYTKIGLDGHLERKHPVIRLTELI